VKRLLLEGRIEVEGPGGPAVVEARGSAVRIDFPTVRAAISAWRTARRAAVVLPLGQTGLSVEVYVRGVRVRRLGNAG
jgi:hypothetical protein